MTFSPDNRRLQASLSIFLCASVWGLFWIPLRYFDESGLQSLWAVAAINGAASIVAIPIALWREKFTRHNLFWLIAIGVGMGSSNVLYFAGLILSDVVRVVFLFYLLPIWATLFSRIFFGVPIGPFRLAAIGVAVVGIWLLLGGGSWPIPQNLGDYFGLLSGMGWALGLAMIRDKQDIGTLGTAAAGLFGAMVLAILLGMVIHLTSPEIQPVPPDFATFVSILPPVLAFGILILWPTILGQLWGAKFVAATTAALLTMSEIVAATISTTLMIGSNLNLISWIGGGLIITAIFIDLLAGQESEDAE